MIVEVKLNPKSYKLPPILSRSSQQQKLEYLNGEAIKVNFYDNIVKL